MSNKISTKKYVSHQDQDSLNALMDLYFREFISDLRSDIDSSANGDGVVEQKDIDGIFDSYERTTFTNNPIDKTIKIIIDDWKRDVRM